MAAVAGGLFALLLGYAAIGCAQEIAPFRLLGVDGYVSSRYARDQYVTEQPGGARSQQGQSDLRHEVFLTTHSYVYHPNFLLLDIGGGPILQQASFDTDTGRTESRGTLYNFAARATLLRDKPYRGSVFYEHLNPTLNIGPGQVINQQSERYGFDASLLSPVTPIPLFLEASRSHFQGQGADRIIDDQLDQFSLRGSYTFDALGSTQVRYQSTRQESFNGSLSLPIQQATSDNREFSVDSHFTFGADRQYDLTHLLTLSSQDYFLSQGSFPARKDLRFLLNLRGRHSSELQSYANYNHNRSEQGTFDSVLDAGSAGVTYIASKDLSLSAGVLGDDLRNSQVSTRTLGANGSAQYQRELPLGAAQTSYGVRYAQRDQEAAAPQTNIIGERLVLPGTANVPLANARVVAGSVVLSNATRTQVYVEGFDYVLSVLGQQTRVQRVITGNILDGQEVLVDYAYDVGGTYSYNQLDQSLNLNWAMSRYFNVYYRFTDSAPHLTSGTPSSPLNSVRSNLAGARADVPLRFGVDVTVGGGYEYEDRRETISPYLRSSYDGYIEGVEPFFDRGTVRLTARRNRIEYETSPQNVDLTGYEIRLWARHPLGIDISADASYEEDTGGIVPRSRTAASIKAQWRVRKLTLTANFGHSQESQGGSEQRRTLFQVFLRRDIGP
jgi:hypothetical protein